MGKAAMRRFAANENTSCRAARASFVEVNSDGFADIRRKWKAVMIASLAAHRKHAGPPIDVVEFQGNDFARSQPKAGQQQNNGAITARDGSIPLASVDHLLDFCWREILGHLRQSPCRHPRNRSCEIRLCLSVLEEKPKEGTQGWHYQFDCAGRA
jgi:hypothetical protein